jgi:hypothetical protein
MPTYRFVLKSEASTPESAAEFICHDTGGIVIHATALPAIEEADCWRVSLFSTDGVNGEESPNGKHRQLVSTPIRVEPQ